MSTIEERMIEHARYLADKTGGPVEVWCWVTIEPSKAPVVRCQGLIGVTGSKGSFSVFASTIDEANSQVIAKWDKAGRPNMESMTLIEVARQAAELGFNLVPKDAAKTEVA